MIRSCEDVRTLVDFHEFIRNWRKVRSLGLKETADIVCWSGRNIIRPELFNSLYITGGKTNV